METENKNRESEKWERWAAQHYKESRIGKVLAGIIVIGIGVVLFARQMGVFIPDWVLTWKMLLICIGFAVGAKRSFRLGGWLIPIFIGGLFLLEEFIPNMSISHYLWPSAIILFGLILMLKPRRRFYGSRRWRRWQQHTQMYNQCAPDEDKVDYTAVFGGIKKNIISKDFKGGEVTSFFGGAEINLMQADITGRVVIDSTQVFGGAKYIVPPHWKIQSELTSVFGGVEDNRPIQNESSVDHDKILVLRGVCVFGGIEISSY